MTRASGQWARVDLPAAAARVLSENGALSIFGHTVDQAGWYTFRHVFGEDGGKLSVTFELASRRGGTL